MCIKILVAACTLALVAGCNQSTGSKVPADRSENGPLSVSEGSGGEMTLGRRPQSQNRSAVFGGLDLCTRGGLATIEAVHFDTHGVAAEVQPVLRFVPQLHERRRPTSAAWAPLSARRGNVEAPRMRQRIPGNLIKELPGATIGLACQQPSTAAPRIELLISVNAGDAGVLVDGLAVDYTSDGDAYTVKVPWTFTLCGDEGRYPNCS